MQSKGGMQKDAAGKKGAECAGARVRGSRPGREVNFTHPDPVGTHHPIRKGLRGHSDLQSSQKSRLRYASEEQILEAALSGKAWSRFCSNPKEHEHLRLSEPQM